MANILLTLDFQPAKKKPLAHQNILIRLAHLPDGDTVPMHAFSIGYYSTKYKQIIVRDPIYSNPEKWTPTHWAYICADDVDFEP